MNQHVAATSTRIPVRLEVPHEWFFNPIDGSRHRQMFTTLVAALAKRNVVVELSIVPWGATEAPRQAPPGGFMLSYHSVGEAPDVWRIKETSIFGYYQIDPLGHSGWSSLCRQPAAHVDGVAAQDAAVSQAKRSVIAEALRSRNLSKYTQSDEPFVSPGRFVCYPLQLLEDPVSVFARIPHLEVLRRAADEAARARRHLLVKRHPFCRNPEVDAVLRDITGRNPFVRETRASVNALIAGCDALIVGNSGVGLEALLHGKPVFSFAASEYEIASTPIIAPDDIGAAFADTVSVDIAWISRFIIYYLEQCCFHIARVETAEAMVDRAIAGLADPAVGMLPTGADQEMLSASAKLETLRRQLVQSQSETEAFKSLAREAVAQAQRLQAGQRFEPSAAPDQSGVFAAIAGAAFGAYADLGAAFRARDPAAAQMAFLSGPEPQAKRLPPSARNVEAADYQKLHDQDDGYRTNNWLVDHQAAILSARPRRIVEIGCGNGAFVKSVARHVEAVEAVDWARSPLLDPLPANVRFHRRDVLNEAIPTGDLCCSADVLEHFEPSALPGLIATLHQAAPVNYHVIACYDDGHSHLALLHPGQWLALFRAHDPRYRLTRIDPRRGRADQIVAVITNLAS